MCTLDDVQEDVLWLLLGTIPATVIPNNQRTKGPVNAHLRPEIPINLLD